MDVGKAQGKRLSVERFGRAWSAEASRHLLSDGNGYEWMWRSPGAVVADEFDREIDAVLQDKVKSAVMEPQAATKGVLLARLIYEDVGWM